MGATALPDTGRRRQWLPVAILCGAAYLAIGLAFARFEGPTREGQIAWRRAAWLVSALVFVAHVAYEQLRLRNSPRMTALHASVGAALASFGLAVAANLHSQPTIRQRVLVAVALVAWPLITAIPAFVVAFGLGSVLTRTTRSR